MEILRAGRWIQCGVTGLPEGTSCVCEGDCHNSGQYDDGGDVVWYLIPPAGAHLSVEQCLQQGDIS